MTSPTNEQQRVDVREPTKAERQAHLNFLATHRSGITTAMDHFLAGVDYKSSAVAELIEKSTQTIAAFESLGNAKSVIANLEARRECENALVAQKAALANVGAAK